MTHNRKYCGDCRFSGSCKTTRVDRFPVFRSDEADTDHLKLVTAFDSGGAVYLAGVEMPVDLHNDLVVFVRRLFAWDDHLSCRQVLQLVHLENTVRGYGGTRSGQEAKGLTLLPSCRPSQ